MFSFNFLFLYFVVVFYIRSTNHKESRELYVFVYMLKDFSSLLLSVIFFFLFNKGRHECTVHDKILWKICKIINALFKI